ncbi:MAG: ketosteroid isomerase [Alphaproteobacteria bacterium]|nr:ketosteroid isomerase [Alphaproteobacteria bacterium]
MFEFDAPPTDHASLKAWMDAFGAEVDALKFTEARKRFDPRVVTFSTFMDGVSGIDQFENEQWRKVWPSASGFRWHTEKMRSAVSPDRLMAFVATTWGSTGYHEDGSTFDRPGRATLVLVRDKVDAPWRGLHAHVSLKRGVPQLSHGKRAA